MNILFGSHSGNLEGAPLSLLSLCKYCNKDSHTCTMVLGSEGMLQNKCKQLGISSIVVPDLMQPNIIPEQWKQLLASTNQDLVVVNTYLGASLVSYCRKLNIPVIWIIRESEKERYMGLFHNETHYFQDANAVIFPSKFTHSLYEEYDKGNFHIVPNGIDVEAIDAFKSKKEILRSRYCIPQDAIVFTSIGSLQPLKGFDVFIQAGIEVLKKHPHTHFFIVGPAYSEEQQRYVRTLMRIIQKHGARSHFHIYGETLYIYDHYKHADAYVCASKVETFPRTILEAMAFGLPVVASKVGGIPEQITGEEGLFFQQGNVKELSVAMEKILEHKEQRHQMGNAGRARIHSTFKEEHMYEQYKEIIETIAKRQESTSILAAPTASPNQPKETVSLIFRASKPKTIPDAVEAAREFFPNYREFIVGASPDLPKSTLKYLESIPHVRFIPGTNEKMQAGDLHYRLMEECTGNWIVNVDDDDMWCAAPPLEDMPKNIGLIYGHHLYCNYYLDPTDAKYFSLEKSRPIHIPKDAKKICGSCWIMRREAFQSFADLLTDRSFQYSDLKMKFLALQKGWKAHYTNRLMGIVRRFTYDFPTNSTVSWDESIQALQTSSA